MSNKNGVTCPQCFKFYSGHTNYFGKVCLECDCFIPPEKPIEQIEANKRQNYIAQAVVRQILRDSLTHDNRGTNADFN